MVAVINSLIRTTSLLIAKLVFTEFTDSQIRHFNYRPQRSCGKVMFSQASVILFTWSLCPSMHHRSHDQGVYVKGVSVHGGLCPGVSIQGCLCPGGLCPGVSVQGGLCRGGVSVQGMVSVWGGLCPGGLCPWGSLSRGSRSRGLCSGGSMYEGLCLGVSVWGVSVQGVSVWGVSARETPLW